MCGVANAQREERALRTGVPEHQGQQRIEHQGQQRIEHQGQQRIELEFCRCEPVNEDSTSSSDTVAVISGTAR